MKSIILAIGLMAFGAFAADNLIQISGPITQRYYPNPNLKIVTHLIIESGGKPYLLLDHPGFANLAEGDTVTCYAVKGSVYEKTGQRIWYYVSDKNPTEQDKQAAATRIMQKYRQEVTF